MQKEKLRKREDGQTLRCRLGITWMMATDALCFPTRRISDAGLLMPAIPTMDATSDVLSAFPLLLSKRLSCNIIETERSQFAQLRAFLSFPNSHSAIA